MTRLLLIALLLTSLPARADEPWDTDNAKNSADAGLIVERLKDPNNTPKQAAELREQKKEVVGRIEAIADTRPTNPAAQLAVSKSLASVDEAPRAIPYAERGLKLAETSGNPKLLRDALLTGSEVYYKAGKYDLARERAQRVLKSNPKDKDALSLYMQVKDRGAGSSSAASGGSMGGGADAAGGSARSGGSAAAQTAAQAPRGPNVAMTSPSSLEASKQIAAGWSKIELDLDSALKHFNAAVAADPRNAASRVQRSKARLVARDGGGAVEDAEYAITLAPGLGEAYAARAEAKRTLGRPAAELLADYEIAARLDGRFTEAYKTAKLQAGGDKAAASAGTSAGAEGADAPAAPPDARGLLAGSQGGWALMALFAVIAAALGGVIVPLVLRRRRSGEDGSRPS